MPANSPVAHHARIGVFFNALSARQDHERARRPSRELADVSNSSASFIPALHGASHREAHSALTMQGVPTCLNRAGSGVGGGGIVNAMKKHPWATGIVVTTAVLATASLASTLMPLGSQSAGSWLENVPAPEPMLMSSSGSSANSATFVGACEGIIARFSQSNHAGFACPSLNELHAIQRDAENMFRMAQNMVDDGEVGLDDLQRAAQCSGVRLRKNTVMALIDDLQTKKSLLLKAVSGSSIDLPIRILDAQREVQTIDAKLSLLTKFSDLLSTVTQLLNTRQLTLIG